MKRISVVTTMVIENEKESEYFDNKARSLGYFFDFESAEKAVMHNELDIYEDRSNFVVIEECKPGFYDCDQTEHWYKWDARKKKYKPCKKPTCYKCMCNFGLG